MFAWYFMVFSTQPPSSQYMFSSQSSTVQKCFRQVRNNFFMSFSIFYNDVFKTVYCKFILGNIVHAKKMYKFCKKCMATAFSSQKHVTHMISLTKQFLYMHDHCTASFLYVTQSGYINTISNRIFHWSNSNVDTWCLLIK